MKTINTQDLPTALVTGGGRRIGAAIVRCLHQAGYQVVIHCCSSLEEAKALAAELNQKRPHSALVWQKDLTSPDTPTAMCTVLMHWSNRLDLLVNNASVFLRSDCKTTVNLAEWELLFHANVKAPLILSLAAAPFLKKQQGCIVNISDLHAEIPLKGYSVYCQSKAALEMQTKSLARELAPEIRVNAVAPGAILWPEKGNSLQQSIQKQIIQQTPLKRHGKPEAIAQAVLALAENTFMTGQIVRVDGGRSLV